MFQFPAFATPRGADQSSTGRVVPFGYVRIISCWQIPAPFRNFLRPSSPYEAKASSVRSSPLSLVNQLCLHISPDTCSLAVSLNSFPMKLQSLINVFSDFFLDYKLIFSILPLILSQYFQ